MYQYQKPMIYCIEMVYNTVTSFPPPLRNTFMATSNDQLNQLTRLERQPSAQTSAPHKEEPLGQLPSSKNKSTTPYFNASLP
eukprot:CAMPEP_0206237576 /NCGR_PEP_ID=MMETSP0047_2-20121206/14342_1 /ASSEMBLY_ACC=CAM_ASM_000192 /TAXON_ID=195065 /ORGANISM="Chroomonas mesostigmatica_cf, Strain CCMP1168" /LENGTH=81 /DNA_ID=CAMNT_0053662027 /DNA_START=30 /DNA_END=275 /DNA_ORIENTATION=+